MPEEVSTEASSAGPLFLLKLRQDVALKVFLDGKAVVVHRPPLLTLSLNREEYNQPAVR